MKQKKAQTGGLVSGLIFGIAGLVIGVIIAFVIVSTLTSSNLLEDSRTSFSVTHEEGNLNATGYTLTDYSVTNVIPSTFSITSIINRSGDLTINPANYSLSEGVLSNISGLFWDDVNVSYTYSKYSNEELSSNAMVSNFTEGVDNVSSKLPTILLIAAIVLILGVLALLVAVWQRMRMGGGGTAI